MNVIYLSHKVCKLKQNYWNFLGLGYSVSFRRVIKTKGMTILFPQLEQSSVDGISDATWTGSTNQEIVDIPYIVD